MVESSQTETWVMAAQRGDQFALAKLLATYHPWLRSQAQARMDAAVKVKIGPDDVLQEVYLDVARQIDRFEDRGPRSFANWLGGILRHKLIDARRAARCQARDVRREVAAGAGADSGSYWNLLDDLSAGSGTPSRVVRRQEALGALMGCVADLSEAHHEVIQLRYIEGRSVAEAARHLDKSEAAVVALCKRALEALRRSMEQKGEFSRGA